MKIIIIPNMPVMTGRHYCFAKTLTEQGHEVHYLMWALPYKVKINELLKNLFTSLIPEQSKYESFTIHKAIRLPYFFPYINGLLFKFQIRKIFKNIKADIIFSESWNNETEVPKDLPFIYDLADDYAAPADVYGSPIYKLAFKVLGVSRVMKRQCQNALAVTVVSKALNEYAKKYNNHIYELPNGVDKKIIQKIIKDKSTYPKNKYSMIYVTGFGPWSRAIETLQTVVILHKEYPLLELNLVGNGVEVPKMLDFIKENKAEKYIHYLGLIRNRETLFKLINKSNIGLNISDKNKWRDAAHPIKVLEYSALGKKVVSTNLNEVKSLNFPNVFIFSDQKGKNNLLKIMRLALEDNRDNVNFKGISKYVLDTFSWEDLTIKLIEIINKPKIKGEK